MSTNRDDKNNRFNERQFFSDRLQETLLASIFIFILRLIQAILTYLSSSFCVEGISCGVIDTIEVVFHLQTFMLVVFYVLVQLFFVIWTIIQSIQDEVNKYNWSEEENDEEE